MNNEKLGQTATSSPETTISTPAAQAQRGPKKGGKTKKPDKTEEKVPMTFSFTPGFVKKLKMLGGSLDESTSEFVESRLSGPVQRELKKILEEMGS